MSNGVGEMKKRLDEELFGLVIFVALRWSHQLEAPLDATRVEDATVGHPGRQWPDKAVRPVGKGGVPACPCVGMAGRWISTGRAFCE